MALLRYSTALCEYLFANVWFRLARRYHLLVNLWFRLAGMFGLLTNASIFLTGRFSLLTDTSLFIARRFSLLTNTSLLMARRFKKGRDNKFRLKTINQKCAKHNFPCHRFAFFRQNILLFWIHDKFVVGFWSYVSEVGLDGQFLPPLAYTVNT